jgi:hypothetical protein
MHQGAILEVFINCPLHASDSLLSSLVPYIVLLSCLSSDFIFKDGVSYAIVVGKNVFLTLLSNVLIYMITIQ